VTDQTDDLLKALVNVMGRVAIPPEKLRPMIAPGARAQKQEKAYNPVRRNTASRSLPPSRHSGLKWRRQLD